MVGESELMVDDTFNPSLRAHELPRETLVDLWRRTEDAHSKLFNTWFSAVERKHGREVAEAVGTGGWPLRKTGATPKELFFDDLENARFIVLGRGSDGQPSAFFDTVFGPRPGKPSRWLGFLARPIRAGGRSAARDGLWGEHRVPRPV